MSKLRLRSLSLFVSTSRIRWATPRLWLNCRLLFIPLAAAACRKFSARVIFRQACFALGHVHAGGGWRGEGTAECGRACCDVAGWNGHLQSFDGPAAVLCIMEIRVGPTPYPPLARTLRALSGEELLAAPLASLVRRGQSARSYFLSSCCPCKMHCTRLGRCRLASPRLPSTRVLPVLYCRLSSITTPHLQAPAACDNARPLCPNSRVFAAFWAARR